MSDLKYIKKIEELQKKVNELYKYKNFVELEKNSKNFFQKFEKINKNNLLLVNHIKTQKNTIDLLKRERDEYKKKLTQLKDDGLTFVNKKKFYEINLKINDLEKNNEELKNIIKNKEDIFLKLNLQITDLKQQNSQYNILINSFINDYKNLNKQEIFEEIRENDKKEVRSNIDKKTKKSLNNDKNTNTTKKGYDSDDENSQLEEISDLELDDNILL